MKKIYQTILDLNNGDCLRACLASLLEIELLDIPNFAEYGDDNFGASYRAWLHELGLRHISLTYTPDIWPTFKDIPVIIVGKSPRGDGYHAVIFQNGVLFHDPYPGMSGLETLDEVWILIPIDIASYIKSMVGKNETKIYQ